MNSILPYRRGNKGILYSPRRGRPKPCPDGYERDHHDEFQCLPLLEPCIHRSQVNGVIGCCRKVLYHYCALEESKVSRGFCKSCKRRTP